MSVKIDWPNIVIATVTVLTMLFGGSAWLWSIDAKASQGAKVAVEFEEFKAEVIDRLARIEEDTKAIRKDK